MIKLEYRPGQKISIKPFFTKWKNGPVLILAHGANGNMNHDIFTRISKLLSKRNINTVCFNFPYSELGKKSPNSEPVLIEVWAKVYARVRELYPESPVFIGGKSLGGRIASLLPVKAGINDAAGFVFLGYPLHAPGRLSMDRGIHMTENKKPKFFIQGTRDALAGIDLIKKLVKIIPNAALLKIEGADHSFRVAKAKTSQETLMNEIADSVSGWINQVSS
ncbi:MAG: alpha/beta fold hydrolase [Spirochaetes bacterium]|nr:alpha/beta fold hydrolase [Spirochaetota bacterium]